MLGEAMLDVSGTFAGEAIRLPIHIAALHYAAGLRWWPPPGASPRHSGLLVGQEADRAAASCFRAWLERRGSAGDHDIEAGIRQVIAYIEAHGSSRFEGAW
jgi:hypothetical protein